MQDNVQGNGYIITGRLRSRQLFAITIFVLALLIIRLIYVQVIDHSFYMELSVDQRKREVELSADRGEIYDRNGVLLATTIDSISIGAHPYLVSRTGEAAAVLSKALNMKNADVWKLLKQNKDHVWIKRKVEAPIAEKIRQKKLEGIVFKTEKKRVYPKKKLASQLLGFVMLDNSGGSGIELSYEDQLKGEPGKYLGERDVSGRDIITSKDRSIIEPTRGKNLTLTIDEGIQYKAEEEIKKAVMENNAKSGSLIVMDIKTGEILALAVYPDFDPNDYQKYKQSTWYNRVILDIYEPGSTFKLVTIASAIENGLISKNSIINCPDTITLGGRTIRNSHRMKFDTHDLSVEQILGESVNTGVAKIAIEMGKEDFYDHIKAFGFGQRTGIGLQGEERGILHPANKWNKPDIAMISFGQSISVTPVQLISYLSSLGNKGIRLKPQIVKKIESDDKSYVKENVPEKIGESVSQKTAEDVMWLSEKVVLNGTGKNAKIEGFRIGGKTGTAQKADPNGRGYLEGHYISSFIGFLPLSDPKLAILVVVDDPQPVYWGEKVAVPAFKQVADYSIRRLNIPPDKTAKTVI